MLYIRDDTGEVAILWEGQNHASVRGFRKIGERLAACLGFSWLRNETAAARRGSREPSLSFLRPSGSYVSELVKRIRLSVESHPRSLRFRLSRERVRFEESSNGLMVYTSWRCALVKTRKSSRGTIDSLRARQAVKEILLTVADSRPREKLSAAVSALVLFSSLCSAAPLGADGRAKARCRFCSK